ncbi:MAG: hypothetical protein LHV68_05230 [Elusimicrobia bacterium]|nr:hypothetical protein [Candidatus Liberimonas magnetica]
MPEEIKEVTLEETARTLVYIQEAIINVLERKEIATRQEIMEEVKNLAAASLKPKN